MPRKKAKQKCEYRQIISRVLETNDQFALYFYCIHHLEIVIHRLTPAEPEKKK